MLPLQVQDAAAGGLGVEAGEGQQGLTQRGLDGVVLLRPRLG